MSNLRCDKCAGTGVLLDAVATGRAMRAKRTAAGVHFCADVARAMGCTTAYISALELGKAQWTPALVSKYELALREALVVREHRAALKAGERGQRKDNNGKQAG